MLFAKTCCTEQKKNATPSWKHVSFSRIEVLKVNTLSADMKHSNKFQIRGQSIHKILDTFTPFIVQSHDLNIQTILNTRNCLFLLSLHLMIYIYRILRARKNNVQFPGFNFKTIFAIFHRLRDTLCSYYQTRTLPIMPRIRKS